MVNFRVGTDGDISVRIVLVQPRNPLNILAAARAARNFGLGDIAVVDVQPAAWQEALHKDVDRETPHGPRATSRGWLGDALKFDTLIEAIAECNWVLGTSSLERRRVSREEVIDLRDLAARILLESGLHCGSGVEAERGSKRGSDRTAVLQLMREAAIAPTPHSTPANPHRPQDALQDPTSPLPTANSPLPAVNRRRVAILFGSEKRGLTNDHLMYCHHLLRIPTVDALPSMNLGQAVAVVGYELARSGVLAGAGNPSEAQGRVVAQPRTECSGESAGAGFAGAAVNRRGAKSSGEPTGAVRTKTAAESSAAANAVDSPPADFPELAENTIDSADAANAAEKQALADYVTSMIQGISESSSKWSFESEDRESYRNLIKMLTRMPLTSEDVRRIFKLIKDARTAKSGSSQRPQTPGLP